MRAMSVRESVPVQSVEETDAIGLDRAALVQMYRDMLLTRGLEDRGSALFKQGKLPGSFYTGRGNEAASVGVASAMGPGDVGAPLHRNMGVHVARGAEPWRLLCQYMGRDGGATHGRDSNLRSQDLSKGLIAGVSHLPGILPTALGVALAFRITGQPNVALGWFGDGASARGDVHECMNFAAVRRLPMVFICDNNQYAYSTPTNLNYACEHLADRASSYGFEGVVVDGTDILAVFREAQAAIIRARNGGGPTMLELVTLRMDGHAIHDDASYVPAELHAAWELKDPIARFDTWLRANAGWTDDEAAALTVAVQADVDEATRLADASPWPDPATVTDGVFA
jgi:TPP-dependent pyruvate/acetoin dehydrogenase alpha subunit